jgi:rhodanese-related sulfurtransferase
MPPFPLPLSDLLGHWGAYVVYLLIGIGFGSVLEMAGFGNSRKLAAQFYFTEQTVLKVMFTAIVVAMCLVFLTSGLGLLDFNLVWVNPTYLWPGVVGGLIMGFGFIIGGFCPGTSLVAATTLKVDGIFFALGTLFGVFAFGETVGLFEDFYYSSSYGRLTLMDMLGLPAGVVGMMVVLMALFMFWGAEQLERTFGKRDIKREPRWRYAAASGLVVAALAAALVGQPTTQERMARMAPEMDRALAERQVQIEPAELLSLIHDDRLNLIMIDVRSESDYNLFHLLDAEHVELSQIPETLERLLQEPNNTVVVVMSNGENASTEAWRVLTAESVPNVYILAGGLNAWIETFGDVVFLGDHPPRQAAEDELGYRFTAALGDRYMAASPDPEQFELEFEPKVTLSTRRGPSGGGCGG